MYCIFSSCKRVQTAEHHAYKPLNCLLFSRKSHSHHWRKWPNLVSHTIFRLLRKSLGTCLMLVHPVVISSIPLSQHAGEFGMASHQFLYVCYLIPSGAPGCIRLSSRAVVWQTAMNDISTLPKVISAAQDSQLPTPPRSISLHPAISHLTSQFLPASKPTSPHQEHYPPPPSAHARAHSQPHDARLHENTLSSTLPRTLPRTLIAIRSRNVGPRTVSNHIYRL